MACHGKRYELRRQRQITENRRMLMELGLGGGPTQFDSGRAGPFKPKLGTRVGITRKRKTSSATDGPARRSSRIKGEAAADVYVTRDAAGAIRIAGAGAAALGAESAALVTADPRRPDRLPEETLSLTSTGGTEAYGADFLSQLRALSKDVRGAAAAGDGAVGSVAHDRNVLKYAGRLSTLRLDDLAVAKVCPDRVYSVVVHPNPDTVLITCGDKSGSLGMWRVGEDGDDAVMQYQPHTRTINMLQYDPTNSNKLYSASYDGTVRCLDVVAEAFEFTTSISDDDGWLQHATVSPDGHQLYVVTSEGTARCIDLRSGKAAWQSQLHDRKINTVDVHPTSPHYIVTASLDKTVRLWDIRAHRDQKTGPGELATLPDTRSVNSASFSPTGDRIVSVGQSNRLSLYVDAHTSAGILQPTHSVPHDNKTGRWLAVFHAKWDPKTDHAFAVGSMSRPRQLEVYSTDGGAIRRIMSLQDPERMGSVQSRCAFHPTRDIVVGCNSSGRVHTFGEWHHHKL